jgi:hypothetical protein
MTQTVNVSKNILLYSAVYTVKVIKSITIRKLNIYSNTACKSAQKRDASAFSLQRSTQRLSGLLKSRVFILLGGRKALIGFTTQLTKVAVRVGFTTIVFKD